MVYGQCTVDGGSPTTLSLEKQTAVPAHMLNNVLLWTVQHRAGTAACSKLRVYQPLDYR